MMHVKLSGIPKEENKKGHLTLIWQEEVSTKKHPSESNVQQSCRKSSLSYCHPTQNKLDQVCDTDQIDSGQDELLHATERWPTV